MRQVMRRVCGGLLLIVMSWAVASAQAVSTAQINGTVTDQSGAALPGVTITVTQRDTGLKREAVTDESGSYVLTNLPIGPYQIEAVLQGFRTYLQTGVVLQVSSNPTVNVTLELGQIAETVSVQGAASMVETRSPGIGQVIDNQRVLELPLNGRQLTQLIFSLGMATGGAEATAAQGAGALNPGTRNYPTVTISVAGGLSNGIAYLLDGGTHNDPFNNLNLPLPFPDALQEFRVETSALPAQYGHHSAAAVNAVTKSGTNFLRGSAFEFFRDSSMNAKNAFAALGPDGKRRGDGLQRNQYGGTLGGPVLRDRLFFFLAYQGTAVRVTPTSAFAFVPTPAMLAGDFSVITSPACNSGRTVALRAPFVNSTVSPALFSPAALKTVSKIPTPADPCGRIFFDRKNDSDEHILVTRGDYQLAANHSLFGRMQFAKLQATPDYDGQNPVSYSNATLDDAVYSFVLGDSYVLGSNTVNSLRVTYNNSSIQRTYTEFFDLADIGTSAHVFIPNYLRLNVSGGFALGGVNALPGATPTTTFQVTEDLSLVRGRHQFGIGANFVHAVLNSVSNVNATGNFLFTGANTGLGLADFMLGRPASFSQGSPTRLRTRSDYIGLYVQDAWRPASRVTINAGLRWDPYFPPYSDQPQFSHFSVDQFRSGVRSTAFRNGPLGVIFHGDEGFPGDAVGTRQWNNLAPRLALVVDPKGDGRRSVRAAYGRFYDLPHLFSYIGYTGAPPLGNVVSLSNPSFDTPWQGFAGGNPFPLTPGPDMVFPNFGGYVTQPLDMPPPYSHQWNVSYQEQLGASWVASANYVASRGRRLPMSDEINPAVFIRGTCGAAACSTTANVNQRRTLFLENPAAGQSYGPITEVSGTGTSSYNGLLLSLQRRSAGGLSMQGNYTLSKCISDRVDYQPGQPASNVAIAGHPEADRGSCGNSDRRHVVNMSTVYQTPRVSSGVLGVLASDWQVSAILTAQSGGFFTVTTGVDAALSGTTQQRPNQVLDNVYQKEGYRWLNPAAFQAPATGTYGNLGANTFQGPGRFNIDTGLTRSFRIRSDQQVQFRAEVFNLLNKVQLVLPERALNSPNFGLVTSAGDPRIVQLALKYLF